MTKLKFDVIGERYFETGVSQGVLFAGAPANNIEGVPWNGLTASNVTPDGGDANDQYADNIKYLSLRAAENIGGTIECFMYPDAFSDCLGYKTPAAGGYFAQQKKTPFSFCWISQYGNDVDGTDYSEKLHIVWNATSNPAEKTYETINESPEAGTMSFEYTTIPMNVSEPGYKPTAYFEITKTTENATKYQNLIDELYGSDGQNGKTSHLMLPDDIITMLKAN